MCVHFLYFIPFIINKVWERRVHQAHLMGRGQKLKLNCMSYGKYRAFQMQDELFIFRFLWRDVLPSLSLSQVSSCFMLWKILLSFSIICDVFFKAVEHSFHSNTLFLNIPERIVRTAGHREGHNVGRKTDWSQGSTGPYFWASNNRLGVSLNISLTDGMCLKNKSVSVLFINSSLSNYLLLLLLVSPHMKQTYWYHDTQFII